MDLSKLQQLAQTEIDADNERGSNNNNGIKLVYPIENGTFRIKLLYKEESNCIQRKVIRHTIGKDKVPCLSMYGQDCPICEAIRNAEDRLGKDCGAYQKYGYKVRGITYAVLMDHDNGMFKDKDSPKKGDLILFMYPPSMYKEINELIVKAGEHIEDLVAKNDGNTIEISRSQKSGGFPEYKINIYPYGTEKFLETDDEYLDFIANLPNINDALVPSNPTEEILEKVRASAESIEIEYSQNSVLNPNDPSSVNNSQSESEVEEQKKESAIDNAMNPPEEVTAGIETTTTETSGEIPECFGNHDDSATKCLVCPMETDCLLKNN